MSADLYARDAAPCSTEYKGFSICQLDMTLEEAFLHWRQLAHSRYKEIDELKAKIKALEERIKELEVS